MFLGNGFELLFGRCAQYAEREKRVEMAYAAMKPTKPGLEEPQEQIHKIRITLSSKHVKNLEKGSFFFHLLHLRDIAF